MAKKAKSVTWVVNGDSGNAMKQVREVLKMSGTFHDRLHIAARSAMIQVLVHSQSTPLVELLTGLSGKSVHVKGLKDWAEKHGNGIKIGLDANKKIKVSFPKGYEQKTNELALDWAMQVKPFWTENPPPAAFKGFNYEAEIARINKKAADMQRALDEGTLEIGGEIVELTEEQKALINLKGFAKARAEAGIILN